MNFKQLEQNEKQYVMQTYNRFPYAFVRGRGATLYDADGGAWVDFGSGIGVNVLGYGDPDWVEAVSKQASCLAHVSNLYYTQPMVQLAEELSKASGGVLKRTFFANSGAEANEGAIKLARKYSFDKYGQGRSDIITLKGSFHGRTVTTLAATGQDHFHDFFFPFTEGFLYADKTMESIRALSGTACAIMMESVQGEGGVVPVDPAFAQEVAAFAAEKDILLIFDEVQTGLGRTGKMFGYEHLGVKPDIISLAKALGGGLPIGAVMCSEKLENVLSAGHHGSTYGGNPIACAGALCVMEKLQQEGFLQSVAEKGAYLVEQIQKMNSPYVKEVRARGMMIGVGINEKAQARDLVQTMLQNGLVTLTAGNNTVRLLPPLTITMDEIDRGLSVMRSVLEA